MRAFISCLLPAVVFPCTAADGKALLRQQPGNITITDWMWGPGGHSRAPHGPFEFTEEDFNRTNPKVKVRDAKGGRWTVKFGGEDHGDVFAAGSSSRWGMRPGLLTYLSGVTDEELRAGLQASGGTRDQVDTYAHCIRERVSQLQHLCESTVANSLKEEGASRCFV
jgi:hypothetical protein